MAFLPKSNVRTIICAILNIHLTKIVLELYWKMWMGSKHMSVTYSVSSVSRSAPGSSVHGDSPGQNTGVGCHFLLQGIFPTQGLNLCLLHRRRIPYCMNHQGRPSECNMKELNFDLL